MKPELIFRACYWRYVDCCLREQRTSITPIGATRGRRSGHVWGLKDAEYIADFCLVAKRTLSPRQYRLFCEHHLAAKIWCECCRTFSINRARFEREIAAIETLLGQTFRDLRPHPLFPLEDYFGARSRHDAGSYMAVVNIPSSSLRFPLKCY